MTLTRIQNRLFLATTIVATLLLGLGSVCLGQNINVGTPFTTTNGGFFENTGVNFGFSIPGGRGNGSRVVGYGPNGLQPNITFSNGFGNTAPAFGGFDPNSAARFGFGRQGSNGGGFSLGIVGSRGSTRSNITTAPSLTVQNGFGGTLSNGQIRPFVVSNTPIVGGGQPNFSIPYQPDNGVTRAIRSGQLSSDFRSYEEPTRPARTVTYNSPTSTATQPDLSVKSIKAKRLRMLAAKKKLLEDTIAAAQALEDERKFIDARIKYREALSQTDDDSQRRRIKEMIKATKLK